MVKVLVVEDDPDLRSTLVDCLALAGHDLRGVGDSHDAYKSLLTDLAQVIVLDVGLPGEDGFSIAKALRGRADLGIVFLTARSSLTDRLTGFDAGADAYFVKPVDCRELAAAVGNLARRIGQASTPGVGGGPPKHQWRLDRSAWMLVAPNGNSVLLTGKEIALVDHLVRFKGEAATRADLIAVLGYRHDEHAERKLDAVVGRLRRKLEAESGEPFPIKTLHAVGYLFSAPVEAADAAPAQPS